MATICVIDDDEQVRETMRSLIERRGHECLTAGDLASGLTLVESRGCDVVFLDVRLPDGDGLAALPRVKAAPCAPEVVILTGLGDPDGAELAIQGGVWDYLVKPSPIKQISLTLSRALAFRAEKTARLAPRALKLDNVIGVSPRMRPVLDLTAQAAACDANVLITGETGTGKELFARTIHANSARAAHPFVAVDCASLTESLVESALFGHVKGAFTGAHADRRGLVEMADKGALFLDEVGELPASLQKALLRVLQERVFRPVGGSREIRSDFRLISATNKDLEAMVAAGSFRQDLLFRLTTVHLRLPPLRERPEDLRPLAAHHVDRLCQRYGRANKGFDPEFLATLAAYDWPGNVRELRNVLERAVTASGLDGALYAMHLPPEIRVKAARARLAAREAGGAETPWSGPDVSPDARTAVVAQGEPAAPLPSFKEFKATAERDYLSRLIREKSGDLPAILEASGLSRSHFYALLKKYNMTI